MIRGWLSAAYDAAGLDERDAVEFWPTRIGSRRAQALQDLRALGEAERVLKTVLASGDADVRAMMSGLLIDTGHVAEFLGDETAAVGAFERSLQFTEADRLLERAATLSALGIAYRHVGRVDDSD